MPVWEESDCVQDESDYIRGFQTMGRDPNLGRVGFKLACEPFSDPKKTKTNLIYHYKHDKQSTMKPFCTTWIKITKIAPNFYILCEAQQVY